MNTLSQVLYKIIGVCIFLVSFLAPEISSAQQMIITEQGDTLVTITPDQVRTINVVFEDHRLLEEKSRLQSERLKLQEKRIEEADTVILRYTQLTNDLKKEMALREIAWENTKKKEKVKTLIIGGVAGVVVGTIVTLLICR